MGDVVDDPAPPRPRTRRLLAEAIAVAATAVATTAVALRVWAYPMRLPWDTRSDATLISAMVKNLAEHPWYTNQPALGAPFGQHLQDFPHGGETFQLVTMKALLLVVHDWGLAMNLYFILGAGAVAGVTHLVLRHLRFGPVIAAVGALLYTALPYRFGHGEMHLWRSTYVTAPLAVMLILWVASWRERFLIDPDDPRVRVWHRGELRWRRVAGAVALAVVIAGTETMTTSFTLTLLAVTVLVGALVHRDPQRLLVGGALALIMVGTFATLSLPTLAYYHSHGGNATAARRFTTESELYALKVTRLVLPEPGHRVGFMSKLGEKGQEHTFIESEPGQALGILGTLGLGGIALAALTRRRGGPSGPRTPPWDRASLRDQGVSITLWSLAFATVGGLSVVMAMVGFAQVRVWNRMVLFIAFAALVEMASRAEQVVAWAQRRWTGLPRVTFAAMAVAVLAFGLADGIPAPRLSAKALERRHASDRSFVAAIDSVLPPGSEVFQLPVLDFPETPAPGRMLDYDPLRAYLADRGNLRWSYGAVKGRPDADWQARLRDKVGPVGALPALLGLGFEGLWVDTWGYTDGGAEVRSIESAVGVAPLVSPDHRFLFFDLRPYRRSLKRSDAELAADAQRLLGVTPPAGRLGR